MLWLRHPQDRLRPEWSLDGGEDGALTMTPGFFARQPGTTSDKEHEALLQHAAIDMPCCPSTT